MKKIEKILFNWQDDDESLDFTLKADEEDSIDFQEPIMDSLKEVKKLENIWYLNGWHVYITNKIGNILYLK